MPTHKSAEKRVRQTEKRRDRNRAAKSAMKTAIKRTKAEPQDESRARDTFSLISRTAKRGVIHRNKAARLASRLQKNLNASKAEG